MAICTAARTSSRVFVVSGRRVADATALCTCGGSGGDQPAASRCSVARATSHSNLLSGGPVLDAPVPMNNLKDGATAAPSPARAYSPAITRNAALARLSNTVVDSFACK